MVWFYLTEKPDIKYSKQLFQSHYGLILSANIAWVLIALFTIFQSHYGLILSRPLLADTTATELSFQSHYGLILSYRSV